MKEAEFGPEFRALENKAAKRKGITQAAFVAEALSQAARRVLSGDDTPESTPAPSGLAQLTALQAAIDRAKERAEAACCFLSNGAATTLLLQCKYGLHLALTCSATSNISIYGVNNDY